ncbi:hypothetical protein LCGC14_2730800 [marine sediment metagenome]|uniref:Uncharacterized protein n=1 Tax=marine sediment metagenome TaxID=412755 RepID=A0A0F9BZ14_9ZZZZ
MKRKRTKYPKTFNRTLEDINTVYEDFKKAATPNIDSFAGKRQEPRILAHDPSVTAWGWVVITPSGKVIETGTIKTEPSPKKLHIRKGDDRSRRITELTFPLLNAIKIHNIQFMVSEQPHGSQSAVAALMIGITAGILQTLSDCLDIGLEWYGEGDCKKAVSGRRSLDKDEMVRLIDKLYEVKWEGVKWKDQAVADALAVFHLASQQSAVLKVMR